jgi:DNA-directed RNA polymerase subunit RPC12/RpoP
MLRNYVMVCGRCYEEVEVFAANCAERPENLKGQPIGQYHCSDCGAMVVAGIAHPAMCRRCLDRVHPAIDD